MTAKDKEVIDQALSEIKAEDIRFMQDNDVPSEEILENLHLKMDQVFRTKRRRKVILYSIAFLVPAVLVLLMWRNIDSRLGHTLWAESDIKTESARVGERKVMVFQDGTKVYLNAGAKISYPQFWGIAERNIKLEGKAFFEVEKNAKRPFVVNIFDTELRVYGTTFNIEAYPERNNVDIVLLEGNVTFEAGGFKYSISPSEKLSFDRITRKVSIARMDNPESASLWTKNIISFRNSSLMEVTDVLSRWYGVEFAVEDVMLYSRKFTFKTPQLPLRSLLDEMEYISDLTFDIEGEKVSVYKK